MSVALAGPLPDPPFSSGGFNPPDTTVYKQELGVGKVISKYSVSRTMCDQKAVSALQKAYPPTGDGSKVGAAQDKWSICVATANSKYADARDKALLKGTPACLDQAGIDGIKAQVDAQLPALGPILFCDDGAANPDPVVGQDIPDGADEAKAEVAVAKAALKAGTGAAKCYEKALAAVVKNAGALPQADLDKFNLCIQKISDKGAAAVAKLAPILPPCLPMGTANAVVGAAASLAGQFTDDTYCAP